MEDVEAVRKRYRPDRVMTLFVGESAPCRCRKSNPNIVMV